MVPRARVQVAASASRAFDPVALRLADRPPSPLPRRVLHGLLALLAIAALALWVGRLDIVAVAEGRLVPRTWLKVVQPAEAGVIREILVGEGEAVVAGQPLVRLDPRLADAEVRALRAELAQRQLQRRRIDAELAGTPLLRHPDDPEDAFASALAQLAADREALRDALAHEVAQVGRIAQELRAAGAVQAKLARTVPIAQTLAERFGRLRAEGFVSELAALERERDRIEREQDLRAQEHTVLGLQSSLAQAERRVAQVASQRRAQLQQERVQVEGHLARLAEELGKQIHRREQVELVAPQAGTVKELATHTLGSVVAPGTVLVTLVPAGDELHAEVLVRNDDAGFVRTGQSAQLKVAAFPFQKFGLLTGKVVRVDADATDPAAARAAPDATGAAPAYRARIELPGQALPFDGARLPLVAGMAVSAEIRLGERSVLEYLLAPVRKAWHEAARER